MNSLTLNEAFERVQALASDFKANEKHYLSPQYQEAEVRKDFIDKLFIALGACRTSRIIKSLKPDAGLLHIGIMTRVPQQAGESV